MLFTADKNYPRMQPKALFCVVALAVTVNAATLGGISTVATLVVTDTAGHTHTTTSVASVASITLGVPEGWSNAGTRALDSSAGAAVLAALLGALLCALV